MDNYAIAENFSLLSKLMDINGENSFKTKTYAIAAFHIEKLPEQLSETARDKIIGIKGIGESVGKKIMEMLDTGELLILKEYLLIIPPGVVEMLNIKGIGPKKIHTIWKEMEIESIGELLYACNENRLTLFKGFGEKTQKNVQEAIEFYMQNLGSHLFSSVFEVFPGINGYLEKLFSKDIVHVTGAFRRQAITIDELEFIVLDSNDNIKPKFQTAFPPELLEDNKDNLLYKLKNGLKLRLYTGKGNMAEQLFLTTGSKEFNEAFQKTFPALKYDIKTTKNNDGEKDEIIFEQVKLPYILPCLRESAGIIEKAKRNVLPELIKPEDIKGVIHSHSNWSDGAYTLEQMASECIKRGLEYLVISDHSKSAFYANGLSEERIGEQQKQIAELNSKLKPPEGSGRGFKIFKSIECDILNDGSLDYTNNILASFDLVIASIHSNLKMQEDKAMLRLLKAIENPYTIILGHMTGRLLLSRNGYPVNHKTIIDACAANHVVIELNAHPRRLDIDWKWIDYAMEKEVLISIDPDAHALDGFDDVKYGAMAAQKGGLTKENNLSSFSLKEFEAWLGKTRKLKGI